MYSLVYTLADRVIERVTLFSGVTLTEAILDIFFLAFLFELFRPPVKFQ